MTLFRNFPGKISPWKPEDPPAVPGIHKGARILIIGGGISGSALYYHLARLSKKHDHPIEVQLVSTSTCNYCGGLMTSLAYQTLQNLYDYTIAPPVVLTLIKEGIYLNQCGAVRLKLYPPMISMLRTDRFGETGFDGAFKQYVKEKVKLPGFIIHEKARALEGEVPTLHTPGWVLVTGSEWEKKIEADYIIIASGLNSLSQPFIQSLAKQTHYVPPRLMPASVTELNLTGLDYSAIDNCVAIIDNLLPQCAVGIISKRPGWVTLTALNREITLEDLEKLFSHPQVRQLIEVDKMAERLRCHMVCRAPLGIGQAKNYLNQRTLFIGDLNGYVRVFKDGYTHALQQAYAAGHELFYHAWQPAQFNKTWNLKYAGIKRDNRWGRVLFWLNGILAGFKFLQRKRLEAVREELAHQGHRRVSLALKSLFTGEVSYQKRRFRNSCGMIV
jgi:hypothetical protein